MTLTERRRETERFTAFVNDRDAGAWPNERLAIRVAEKNLALAQELNDLCLQLMMAYRSAMRSYAATSANEPLDMLFNDDYAGREIMKRVTRRGHGALARAFGPHPLFNDLTTESDK